MTDVNKAGVEIVEYFKLMSRDNVNKPLPFTTFLKRLKLKLDQREKKLLRNYYEGKKNALLMKRKMNARKIVKKPVRKPVRKSVKNGLVKPNTTGWKNLEYGGKVKFMAKKFFYLLPAQRKDVREIVEFTPTYVVRTTYKNNVKIGSIKETMGRKYYESSRKYYLGKVKR